MSLPKCVRCNGTPTKGTESIVNPKLHSVCDRCGDIEYQECLVKIGAASRESVSALQRNSASREGGKEMTYTLSKMSGKAVRLIARYLAILEMGGKLTDTPDQFYDRYTKDHQCAMVEAERHFGELTDAFESKVRDEEGFIGNHYDVIQFVQQKLGEGFSREGETVADRRSSTATAPPPRRKTADAPSAPPSAGVKKVMQDLEKCSDPIQARMLRRKLRRLGHRGGLRSNE